MTSHKLQLKTIIVWLALILLTAIAIYVIYESYLFNEWPWLNTSLVLSTLTCLWAYTFGFIRLSGSSEDEINTLIFGLIAMPFDVIIVYPGASSLGLSSDKDIITLIFTLAVIHSIGFYVIWREIGEYIRTKDEPIDRTSQMPKIPSNTKILIVTDDTATRVLLVGSLEDNFPQIEVFDTAHDGKEALEKVNNEFYAAIVSSVIMPGMNGIEFYNLAMEKDSGIKERIVFISGYDGEEVLSFINNNNLRWLKQPFKIDDLTSMISDIFNNQATA